MAPESGEYAAVDNATITLHVEGEWELTVAEVWPDGPPDVIDAEAVTRAFRRHTSVSRLLHDWHLDHDLVIEVDVLRDNPEHQQDEALFPEHAASPTIHSKAWWPL